MAETVGCLASRLLAPVLTMSAMYFQVSRYSMMTLACESVKSELSYRNMKESGKSSL